VVLPTTAGGSPVLVFGVVKLEPFEPGSAPPVTPGARCRAWLARFAVALVLVAGTIGFADAHAASADVFRACGRSGVANGGGVSCMTLSAAITAAQATNGPDTIELFPGSYCPIAIADETGGITIQGMGLAGIQAGNGPTGLTGSEAELATFSWDSSCGGSAPNALITITNPGNHFGSITLSNLAVDGSGGGSQDGIDISDVSGDLTTLRDVEAENNSHFGIEYFGDDFEMDNSATIGNAYGLDFVGEGSAVNSTFANNTVVGVELGSYDFHLINDTVSGNMWGVDAPGNGNHLQVVDTIVAGNGTGGVTPTGGDCKSTVDWEDSFSSHVLKGSGCTTGSGDDGTDIAFDTGTTMPAPALNGGPTPSILPTSQAVGHGTSCASSYDQREFKRSGACTIGSVDPSADGTPDPEVSPSPLDFGQVDVGVTASASESVFNLGGDYVGVSSVSATGGFTIGFDGCTDASLAPFGCSISVSLPTPAAGHHTGTLTIDTTGGEISVPVSADAVVRPLGNTDSYDVDFDRQLVVSAPGVLANDAPGTTVYDVVDQPSDGTLEGPASDGSFTYTPADGFSGDDSFTYRIVDGLGAQSDPITVNLAVSGPVFYVNAAWAGTSSGADPDGPGPATAFGVDAFATITGALNASRDSTIIHVEAGTYSESSPEIQDPDVQLLGDGAATTHLTVATSLQIEGRDELVSGLDIHGTVSSGSPAVRFDGPGSTLQASTVSGAITGVFVNGSSDEEEDEEEDAMPIGLTAPLFDFTPTVTVSDDDIHGVALGIDFSGVANGVIEGNDIHDLTSSTDDYLAAILIEDDNYRFPETGNVIDENTIAAGAETGIDVETSGNSIGGNTITGDDVGIYLSDDSEDAVNDNEITNNTITESGEDGIQLESGVDGVNIDDNTISGTEDDGESGHIVDQYGAAILLDTFGPSNVSIEFNHLTDNTGWGILQQDSGGASTGNKADENDITGNGVNGVENDDTASFDARSNWWGSASGPSGVGPGTGDGVTTVVLFDPWLLCPFEADSCAGNEPPTAAFTATPSTTPGSLSVAFDGSASGDSDGTIADWSWDFGDSSSGDGETANHTYSAPGTYTVTLTVTDDGGATDRISHDVTVPAVPANQTPIPAFTVTQSLNPATPLLVSVDGTASHDPDGTIASYAWNFGDSTSGSGAATTHTYATGGTYTIQLTVTDSNGATDHISHQVTVPVLFTLTVTTNGTGTVTSGTGGIVCPGTCSATYSPGTVVVLTETPGAAQPFSGWSGACSGAGSCSVTMNAAMSVTATFATSSPPPPPPTPSASIGDATHPEGNTGDTPFVFTVTLSGAADSAVTIGYATADGTASSPSDYAATSGTLTFAPGQTSATVTVTVHGDTTPENDETFTVNLTSPSGATIADGQGLGTIQNDDPAADLSVTQAASVKEPDAGETMTYTITVANRGPQAAAAPVVVDTLPAGVLFVSATSGCKAKGTPPVVTCTLKPVAPGGSSKLELVVTPNIVGTVTNTVTVSSTTADPTPANNTFKLSTKVDSVDVVNPSGPLSCAIQGTAGADTITSNDRRVHICTGAGNDTIDVTGGSGGDVIDAGSGNDVIYANNGKVDTIDGGSGYDTCICDPSDHVVNIERRVGQ
jgi:uncharacterized repeat protein (TIGR01451 family)